MPTQSSHEGDRLPVTLRHVVHQSLATDATAVQASHPGIGGSLIDEHQPRRIKHALVSHPASPRTRHAAALLIDGRVLLAGGHDNSYLAIGTTELFDPARRSSEVRERIAPGADRIGFSPTVMARPEAKGPCPLGANGDRPGVAMFKALNKLSPIATWFTVPPPPGAGAGPAAVGDVPKERPDYRERSIARGHCAAFVSLSLRVSSSRAG